MCKAAWPAAQDADIYKASSNEEGTICLREQRILQRTKTDTNELETELYLSYAMEKGFFL